MTCSAPPLTVHDAAVDEEASELLVVEVGAAQHVALPAGHVAGLRVARAAGLVLPEAGVLLGDDAELAVRLAVAGGVLRVGEGAGSGRRPAPCESAYRNSGRPGGTWRLTVPMPNGENGTM